MRRISLLFFFLIFLLSLGAANLCSVQWPCFDPEVRGWKIDVESGQFWPVDKGSPHWRLKRGNIHRIPISWAKERVLRPVEGEGISGIIKDDFWVNDDTTGGWHHSVAVGMDSASNFVICWEDERNGYPDIYAQRYSSVVTHWGQISG